MVWPNVLNIVPLKDHRRVRVSSESAAAEGRLSSWVAAEEAKAMA